MKEAVQGNVVWKSVQPHQLKGTRYKVLASGMRLSSSSLLSPLPAHFVQVNSHIAGTKGQLFMAPDIRLWLLTQHPDFSCIFLMCYTLKIVEDPTQQRAAECLRFACPVLYSCFTGFTVGKQHFIDGHKYVCYPPNLWEIWLLHEQIQ